MEAAGTTNFTFNVDKVKRARQEPSFMATAEEQVQNITRFWNKFEDFSHSQNLEADIVKGKLPGLMLALHTAYQEHYPLKLSVSDFIILIGQGLGQHLDKNAEDLRHHFVDHKDKETIKIRRDQFRKGQKNDWSTVFGDFTTEIKERVKTNIYDIIIDTTSVATQTTRIVSEITLMDAMKNYFKYVVQTLCGIPQITLVGKSEDWEILREKGKKLLEINKDDCLKMKWWLDALIPTINKICDTAVKRQVIDLKFWSGIYKYEDPGSGTPEISGWILSFFPYLEDGSRNNFSLVTTDKIPQQVSKIPFVWQYLGEEIPMLFYGGFLGAKFNESDFSIQPETFWCVQHDETKELDRTKKKLKVMLSEVI